MGMMKVKYVGPGAAVVCDGDNVGTIALASGEECEVHEDCAKRLRTVDGFVIVEDAPVAEAAVAPAAEETT
jgi:hypothetical protein